jgi:hypothetical protein
MSSDPVIDARTGADIIQEASALGAVYAPEWRPSAGDSGEALIAIFARLMEIVISRLNRVPGKNFLAFLDTAGIHLLPPKAARVPVKFLATTGAKSDGAVPARTQIATAPAPGQDPLTFETEEALTVSRSRLIGLYSHDPGKDQYTQHEAVLAANEQNQSLPFQAFAGLDLIPHRLYLSQDPVFRIGQRTKLTLVFRLEGLSPQMTDLFQNHLQWKIRASSQDIRPVQALTRVNPAANEITVILDDPQLDTVSLSSVNTVEGYWVQAETTSALSRDQAKLKIRSVNVKAGAVDIKPAFAFFNATKLDLERECRPFGEKPKAFDTFSLALPEALVKTGSRITLQPAYQKGGQGAAGVELRYEFYNGNTWETLGVTTDAGVADNPLNKTYDFADTTKAFTADSGVSANIQFDCPSAKPADVNGQKNYWLRVRITNGNYGEDARMELEDGAKAPYTLDKWKYVEPSFKAPVVISLSVSYEYASGQNVTVALRENNFSMGRVDEGVGFKPFAAAEEDQPACYLGFDGSFSARGISVYIAVEEALTPVEPRVVWEYWTGSRWKNLGVQDGTMNFTQSGVVQFIGPADAASRRLFNLDAWWLRARLEQGDQALTRLSGIHLNTVWARNTVTVQNELLGSSTETPGASYTLSRYPVLEGIQLEVREPERPSDEDLQILSDEEGQDAVRPVGPGEGTAPETWVRWHRVDHFRLSGKKSRHYLLDWFTGRVQFGDGLRGMIPPAGRGNIRVKGYQAGGGAGGNTGKNTVTVLKRAIPFVDKAFNVDQAGGGADGEIVDQVKVRGPQTIKNQARTVTWEDYEWLAKEASLQVARARCLPAKTKEDAGLVRLIIVPRSGESQPLPSQGLIRQVKDYLNPRERRIGTANLSVSGPRYVAVSVDAKVFPEKMEEADLVRRRVVDNLTAFFHPLFGGPEKTGWEFGRNVYVSEVCKVIEDTEGVHHSENVTLSSAGLGLAGRDSLPVPDDALVASGGHSVTLASTG